MRVGSNLTGLSYFNPELPLVDEFREASPWVSGQAVPDIWDDGRAITVDSDGWVTALLANQKIRTLLFRNFEGRYPAGDYVVLYEGTGTLAYAFDAVLIDATPNRNVIRVTPTSGGAGVAIFITATNASPNHLKNIRVIPPGGICSNDIFTKVSSASSCSVYLPFETNYESIRFLPQFMNSVRKYACIRFMDWSLTNNSTVSDWADRPLTTDYIWDRGIGAPLEVMIELCNKLLVPPWFTIPHLATDAFATSFAALVKANLDPRLSFYVEFTNEFWNSVFSQGTYCQNQGLALGLSGVPFTARMRFYSQRSVEIFNLFRAQFPGEEGRVIRVMGSQAASTGVTNEIMNWLNAYQSTDVLAIAPYFGGYLGAPVWEDRVETWTSDMLFAELGSTAMRQALGWTTTQAARATSYGVDLVLYEGGQHLVGITGVENNATIQTLFNNANADPRMGGLYDMYLASLDAAGVNMFVHYLNCGIWNKFGSWGAMRYIDDPLTAAPKYESLMNFIDAVPVRRGGFFLGARQ